MRVEGGLSLNMSPAWRHVGFVWCNWLLSAFQLRFPSLEGFVVPFHHVFLRVLPHLLVRLHMALDTKRAQIVWIETEFLHLLNRFRGFDGNHMVAVHCAADVSSLDAGGLAFLDAPLT